MEQANHNSLQPLLCWFNGMEKKVFLLQPNPDDFSPQRIVNRVFLLTDNGDTVLDTNLGFLRQDMKKPLKDNQRKNRRFYANILTKTQCNKIVNVAMFFTDEVIECVQRRDFVQTKTIMTSSKYKPNFVDIDNSNILGALISQTEGNNVEIAEIFYFEIFTANSIINYIVLLNR